MDRVYEKVHGLYKIYRVVSGPGGHVLYTSLLGKVSRGWAKMPMLAGKSERGKTNLFPRAFPLKNGWDGKRYYFS